jgi:hypothetical protein
MAKSNRVTALKLLRAIATFSHEIRAEEISLLENDGYILNNIMQYLLNVILFKMLQLCHGLDGKVFRHSLTERAKIVKAPGFRSHCCAFVRWERM